jgi:hypothetical protein
MSVVYVVSGRDHISQWEIHVCTPIHVRECSSLFPQSVHSCADVSPCIWDRAKLVYTYLVRHWLIRSVVLPRISIYILFDGLIFNAVQSWRILMSWNICIYVTPMRANLYHPESMRFPRHGCKSIYLSSDRAHVRQNDRIIAHLLTHLLCISIYTKLDELNVSSVRLW